MTDKQILLVRHGETGWNNEGRVQGWAPSSLNERGARQARAVGRYLRDSHPNIATVQSSDLQRAVETTELICDRASFTDVSVTYDENWRERNFGVYQGFDNQTLFSRFPEYALSDNGMEAAKKRPELGETYLEFDQRVISKWLDFVEKMSVDKALIIAHSGTIRQIIAYYLNYDPIRAVEKIELPHCHVTLICPDKENNDAVLNDVDLSKISV